MIGHWFIPLNEFLFYLTGGVPLVNSLWFIVWIIGMVFIFFTPIVSLLRVNSVQMKKIVIAVMFIGFFPWLLTIASPGFVQLEMLIECRPDITQTVSTDNGLIADVHIRECRVKENFYGEFGSWTAKVISQSEG